MRYFIKPMSIKIPPSVISKANTFAKAVANTVTYSDSNQSQKQKIREDHFISKIGEEAVYRAFKLFTENITKPDYTIYTGNNKSWDCDLIVDDIQVAVKTQKSSSAAKYGLSWTFQDSQIRSDPVLHQIEAWVCFVECDDCHDYKCRVFPPKQVKELKFREPVLIHLRGKKKVVYADDL